MYFHQRTFAVTAAFCFLAALHVSTARAQSLGDTIDGITGSLGVGGVDGTSVSVGDSNTGSTASVGSVGADGTSVDLLGNLAGTNMAGDANLNTTDSTSANVNLGVISGLLGTSLDGSNTNASIGLPGVGTVGLNQSGTTLGLGIQAATTPADQTTTTTVTTTQVASLSNRDLARYKVRCAGILSSPGSYDKDLLALCRMIASAAR